MHHLSNLWHFLHTIGNAGRTAYDLVLKIIIVLDSVECKHYPHDAISSISIQLLHHIVALSDTNALKSSAQQYVKVSRHGSPEVAR